ncbi:MAG: iron-containing alcohol dehydrogenase [Planctomycetota bacterium]
MTSLHISALQKDATTPSLPPFDYHQRTRLIFGAGCIKQLPQVAAELRGHRVLLVTDPGIQKAGHCDRAVRLLEATGHHVWVFDSVPENPTTADVDRCVAYAKPSGIDLIIGLGGGSSMDCAKGANFLLTNGGRMQDYRGIGKAALPMLPMIAIPTTSGTGSEAQSFAVIADADTHMKMACGDVKAACRVALLDPELTVSMPRGVTAATGIDAMTHAMESYVTTKRNTVSQMFARQAWSLLAGAFSNVLTSPDDLDARGRMQLGAFLAGAAIENSMLGAAHAAANPLTAMFGTTHGAAVGLMMPHVIRWNCDFVGSSYHELALTAGWISSDATESEAADVLAERFTEQLRLAGMKTQLLHSVERPVCDEEIRQLASEAALQWTGTFNPVPMNPAAFEQLYRNAV